MLVGWSSRRREYSYLLLAVCSDVSDVLGFLPRRVPAQTVDPVPTNSTILLIFRYIPVCISIQSQLSIN